MTIMLTFICSTKVEAQTQFYEGEYIDGIYMNKQKTEISAIYYQKARFFRQVGTNQFAYCIDPFIFFTEGSTYEETINPNNLTQQQKERITEIAYFGYGYHNHTDKKWYAITQFMIWQTADPTANFYFTDGLNGPRIEAYTQEMNEINTLITNYHKSTSLLNKTYTVVEGETIFLEDTNNIISTYSIDNPNFRIEGNKIIGDNLTKGEYTINLLKQENHYNKPILFYQALDSQALMQTGDIPDKTEQLKINVINTLIEITKIDKDTQSIIASGDGSLIGAIYGLFNQYDEKIAEITINENSKGIIKNIPFGTYYLQEIVPPKGYQLDTKKYEITISEENPNQQLILENEIIKKKVIIYKTYDETNKIPEKNINFLIFDKDNNLITTITTDEFGKAEIILPYGEYKIVQENTTEGYQKVEDIELIIDNMEDEIIKLTDYKIKVPNTRTNFITYFITLIIRLFNI